MPSEPLVSVLTPSFNQAGWLTDNLRSVECQTYGRIEHIVMDGGSQDGSLDVLKSAGPNVHWRSEPDRGQAHALNKALTLSRGEIVGWLNSDDAYFDNRVVADVVRFFARSPGIDVVYGHAAYVSAAGRILHYFWAPTFNARLLRLYDYLIQPAAFVRRRAIGERLLDESFDFAMDHELWLRLSQSSAFARYDRILAADRGQPARKSLTRLAVFENERGRLAARYGVATSATSRVIGSAHHVYCRFRGARLVFARHADLAFSGREDPWPVTLWRQVAQRRSTMALTD
jgi:glycosyltransferase involved in cell wall biosynthesis